MNDSELASGINPDELERVLRTVRQGDLLDIGKIVSLWSPDSPLHPSEVEGVPHEEPMMTMETGLESGLCAIISQDCDLRRLPYLEPYVFVSPMREIDNKLYREASEGMSVRYFAYPPIPDYEEMQLALDSRLIQSIEKTALLSPHVEKIASPLSEPRRTELRAWLGNRLGRPAYPDEIVRQVVQPIERALARAREKDQENVFACVIWIGLRWTPGKRYCSLLLLTEPALRSRHRVEAQHLGLMLGRLTKALDHFAGRAGDHTIIANVHDVTEVAAVQLLEHHELTPDVEAAEL